jgi:hypothetical protein
MLRRKYLHLVSAVLYRVILLRRRGIAPDPRRKASPIQRNRTGTRMSCLPETLMLTPSSCMCWLG